MLRSDRKTNMPNIDEDERIGVGVALYIREGRMSSVSKLVIDRHSVDELLSLDIDSLCVILKVKRKRHYFTLSNFGSLTIICALSHFKAQFSI